MFDFGSAAFRRAWSGSSVSVTNCTANTTLIKTRALTAGDSRAFLAAGFTDVPAHTLLRLRLRLIHTHPAGRQYVAIRVNNALLWESTADGVASADVCSPLLPARDVLEFVIDAATTVSVDIFASLVAGTYVDTPQPGVAVDMFELLEQPAGSAVWSSSPDTFATALDGWLGPYVPASPGSAVTTHAIERIDCSSAPMPLSGIVLGGLGSAQAGSILSKIYTGLDASHRGLLVQLVVVLLDWRTNDAKALLSVDGTDVWSAGLAQAAPVLDGGCSGATNVRYYSLSIILPQHTGTSATLQLSAPYSIFAGLPFALYSPRVLPLALPAGSNGSAPYAAGTADFTAADYDAWIGGSGTDTCQREAATPGLAAVGSGSVDAFVAKTFTGLDAHSHVRVRATYYFTQRSGEQEAQLSIDGNLVWTRKHTDTQAACVDGTTFAVPVDYIAQHTASTVSIQYWGVQSSRLGGFVIADVAIEVLVPGPRPLPFSVATFDLWSEGFSGTRLDRTTCSGGYGKVLGGDCLLGAGASLSVTYTQLPPHEALQVDLVYFAIHSWDYEEGQVYVDDVLVWHYEFTGARTFLCGDKNAAAQPISLTVRNHKASSVTIRITSTLSQTACDESFAIDDVLVTPFNFTVGAGIGAWTAGVVDFGKDTSLAPFAVPVGELLVCSDDQSTSLATRGGTAAEAIVAATFTDLPAHTAVRVTFDVVYRHTAGDMTVRVSSLGTTHHEHTRASRGVVDGCGEAEDSHRITILLLHTGSSFNLDVTARVAAMASEPAFALRQFTLQPITLGTAAYMPESVDTFEDDEGGWLGAGDAVRTTCSSPVSSTILGGLGTSAPDAITQKTYTGLPQHAALVVRFDYLFLGWSRDTDVARLRVDTADVWTQVASAVAIAGTACSGRSTRVVQASAFVPVHTAESATLVFDNDGSIYGGQNFGVDNVRVLPVSPSGGSGVAVWTSGPEDFTSGRQEWTGSNVAVTECSNARAALDSSQNNGPAFAMKRYLQLPSHDVLHVKLHFAYAHAAGTQHTELFVDGALAWSDASAPTDPNHCSDASVASVTIDIYMTHTAEEVSLQLWGEADNGASGFFLFDVSVETLELGKLQYSDALSDFSKWSDGWLTTSAGTRTKCDGWNTMLGGHAQLGTNAYATKVYTDLPAHDSLRLEMGFVALRTW